MGGMRVHELAKEFGMSSKELLDILVEMKIPAKNHASTLVDAYVTKIRKNVGPEVAERAARLESEKEAQAAALVEKEASVKAEAEAQRKAAAEAERERRELEKAERAEFVAQQVESEGDEYIEHAPFGAPGTLEIHDNKPVAHAEGEAASASDGSAVQESAAPRMNGRYSDLLSQIEAEKTRLQSVKSAEKGKPAAEPDKTTAEESTASHKRDKAHKKTAHERYAEAAEEAPAKVEDDRYAKMAADAAQFQKDRVLAEVRAAVEQAQTEDEGRRRKRKEKRIAQAKARATEEAIEKGIDPDLALDDSVIRITEGATVDEFAQAVGVPASDVIKRLFLLGQMLTLTQTMSNDLIELIASDLGRQILVVSPEEEFQVSIHDDPEDLLPRSPVVTVMGHVDHGKTSLLDAIRSTGVAENEAGGITQHIGASVVEAHGRHITFIDTPGHEAFTAMRARGAKVTDVVVLVVAADDGVMPQTIEAINHAEAAGVPIVVAVNKIDKPGAQPDRVRQELTEHGIIPEDWGGRNMFVEVSARQRINIDDLLETILLQADVLELKANPDALASGFVIESKLDKGRGPVATVLVQRGTLRVGDAVVVGTSHGRVRALVNPKGDKVDQALPADPVEIIGLGSVPQAGDEFRVFADERDARALAEDRALRARLAEQQRGRVSLDDLFERMNEGEVTELNLIVKADVQGSIEALKDALDKMDQSEVKINVIHSAVGGITETDVTLATASDAIIIGFGVRPQPKARVLAEKEKVDIRTYRVIYKAIEDINAARVGKLSPDIVEVEHGSAEVRDLFRVPKAGVIAGSYVTDGEIGRDDNVRIVRDGTVVHEGTISSLRRFKDDVKSVRSGYECGIGITGFQDIKEGDIIEAYTVKEVAREA
jgi:translation initiation factor IF-2